MRRGPGARGAQEGGADEKRGGLQERRTRGVGEGGGVKDKGKRRKGAEGRRCAGRGRYTAGGSWGCVDGGHRRETRAEGTGPAAGADGAAEYGSADGCGQSGRAADSSR